MNVSKIEFQLEEIGLTKSETKVYLSLLELGPSTTGHIIEKSQTANSKIYLVLDKLINKGLVVFFNQKGLKYYKASNPSQILRYPKEEQRKIEVQENKIEKLLPLLNTMAQRNEEENEAVIFKGPKGVKAAFNVVVDTLEKNEEINVMGTYKFEDPYKNLALYFQKIRNKKGIKANYLINKNARNIADLFAKYPPVEIRLMDEGVFTPAIFIIFRDRVIISLGNEMVMFMIKGQTAADTFNVYFNHMWKTARKYVKRI